MVRKIFFFIIFMFLSVYFCFRKKNRETHNAGAYCNWNSAEIDYAIVDYTFLCCEHKIICYILERASLLSLLTKYSQSLTELTVTPDLQPTLD